MPLQTFSLTMNTSARQYLLGHGYRKVPSRSLRSKNAIGSTSQSSDSWRASCDSNSVGTKQDSDAGESFSGTVEVVRRY